MGGGDAFNAHMTKAGLDMVSSLLILGLGGSCDISPVDREPTVSEL